MRACVLQYIQREKLTKGGKRGGSDPIGNLADEGSVISRCEFSIVPPPPFSAIALASRQMFLKFSFPPLPLVIHDKNMTAPKAFCVSASFISPNLRRTKVNVNQSELSASTMCVQIYFRFGCSPHKKQC